MTETADYYRGYHAGLERAAKYHDGQASDCRAIAAVNQDNDLGPDCETHAIDHEVAADDIRAISRATAPQCPKPVTDWEDVAQRTNVAQWCDSCQSNHWSGQCNPDDDRQRFP